MASVVLSRCEKYDAKRIETLLENALKQLPEKTARMKKLGFPVPIRVWLKEDTYFNLVKDRFTSPAAEQFFHTEKLVSLLEDHRAGKADNSRKIWTVFMFLVWYGVYFENGVKE